MDRERLTELLRDPTRVTEGDLASLRSMAERYPWFGGARLLLAVGEHRAGDLLTQEGHGMPAAFLPSREVLFGLTQGNAVPPPAPLRVVREEHDLEMPEATEPAQVPEVVKEQEAPEAQAHPVPEAPLPEAPEETPAPEENRVEAAPSPLVGSSESGPAPMETSAPAPQEPSSPPEPTPIELPTGEKELLDRMYAEALGSTYDLGQLSPLPAPEAAPGPEVPTAAPVEERPPASRPPERLRFTDWLSWDTDAPPATPDLPEAPAVQAPKPPKSADAGTGPKLDQREIMDRFIQQENPQPAREKAAFFNPQQAAKRSLQDDGLVSETLARIHEQQGNFAKAKEIYDRLSAKHPEKSVYFAALSKALEGRMNK